MHRPRPADFGINQQDLDWAKRAEQHIVLALFLASALGWGLYAWFAPKLLHPLLLLRALIVGFCLVFVTAHALAFPARRVLYLASARYRRTLLYRRAHKKFLRDVRRKPGQMPSV